MNRPRFKGAACLLLFLLWAMPTIGFPTEQNSEVASDPTSSSPKDPGLTGPGSVTGTLKNDSEARASAPAGVIAVDKYFDFKKHIEEKNNLGFGFDYNALFQAPTDSPGEDTAAGGVFRAFGQWAVIDRGKDGMGMLVFKFENRHRLGSDMAPKDWDPKSVTLGSRP